MSESVAWRPSLGAWPESGGVRFRVWSPAHDRVELILLGSGSRALERDPEGYWNAWVPNLSAGAQYAYRLDGAGPYPDPASRSQPKGVHGPSCVVDPMAYAWSHPGAENVDLEALVIYELHVGTFTPEGTYASTQQKLGYLRDLGVTAIELMPLGDFPGARNWGYDGVDLFAPARAYGPPDDLRRLVDAAHGEGLVVLLDVVYNHLGPDGAYLSLFSRSYFSDTHQTPWGQAVNLDGPASEHVRGFFIENAQHWIHEYRIDGLRLDACHALIDESPRHFLAELQHAVRASAPDREILIIAEDSRNLVRMVQPESEGGLGLDAVWADDLHHQFRVGLAGDRDGYYADFSGSIEDLARTMRDGWFYRGQVSHHWGGPRGTQPVAVPRRRFVVCLQNHDQVGNRALGERLHHEIEAAQWRAASTLLLLGPETPLLFMGQEWGATSPFLFFTDHSPELGRLVTAGRRKEFADFQAFADVAARAGIPDPQAEATFRRSRLEWNELTNAPHEGLLRLYRALLSLRREARVGSLERHEYRVLALGGGGVALLLERGDVGRLLVVACVGRGGTFDLARVAADLRLGSRVGWHPLLNTEQERYVSDPRALELELTSAPRIRFMRSGAVVLRHGPRPPRSSSTF